MQKAKESVQAFIAKAGHHDTTVHETVAPAVQHEVVKPHEREEVTTATDKEVHQDHYHHTVQPVKDREVLPEQHHHNMMPVQHREVDHRDHESVKRNVADVQGRFKDQREVQDTTHSRSVAPAVGGEHVHHHVHETIQPVLHKETIQPSVVHTTVPIHEVHHNTVKHHETSELPPLSINEFKKKGGSLHGREEKYDAFEGEPREIGGILGNLSGTQQHNHRQHQHRHSDGENVRAGGAVQGERRAEEQMVGDSHHGDHLRGDHNGAVKNGAHPGAYTGETHSAAGAAYKGPSMTQKLNPFKDADGDGRKGIMD